MGPRALIVVAALACACGPRPRVSAVELQRRQGRLVALVSLENAGGEGEVSLSVRLTDRRSGAVFVQERGVPMEAGKRAWAAVAVEVPPGDYDAAAQAVYPP